MENLTPEQLQIALSLLEFIDAILINDNPMITHFGVMNMATSEQHPAVSIWGCLVGSDKEPLNPIQRLEQLADENENLKRWIPIEEGKPEKEGHYLVKVSHSFPKNCNVIVAEFYEDNQTFYCECNENPIKDATHWREIQL